MEQLTATGWPAIIGHDDHLADRLRRGLAAIDGVRLLGPAPGTPALPLAAFTVDGTHHALVAARLSAEYGIAVRHGCFCAHPYLLRLLDLDDDEVTRYRQAVLAGDRRDIPGAVRASAGINTTAADVDHLLAAIGEIAGGRATPVGYDQDPLTGDYHPAAGAALWSAGGRGTATPCAQG
jgi:selenocysteine lyase/cysteine desulfurase